MEEHVRFDILDVLSHAQAALEREDVRALKELSNMTIHNASIHQDSYSILTAVLVYTLAKVYERPKYEQYKGWSAFCKECTVWMQEALQALEEHDDALFEKILKNVFAMMKKLDPKLRVHVRDVVEKAKVSKAFRLHEHGISIGRTAELLGVTQYELMEYVGTTYIGDVKENMTLRARRRLQMARDIFQ